MVLGGFQDALAVSSWFYVVLVVVLGTCGVVFGSLTMVLSIPCSITCTSLAESSAPSSSRRSPCVFLALPPPPAAAESSSGATGGSNPPGGTQ